MSHHCPHCKEIIDNICPACKGFGVVDDWNYSDTGTRPPPQRKCLLCGGYGSLQKEKCKHEISICGGGYDKKVNYTSFICIKCKENFTYYGVDLCAGTTLSRQGGEG